MADKLDSWRVARQLLDRHGRDAEAGAERHRQHCVERRLTDGQAFWIEVVAAIAQLRAVTAGTAQRH
jgi:hypothetical protein